MRAINLSHLTRVMGRHNANNIMALAVNHSVPMTKVFTPTKQRTKMGVVKCIMKQMKHYDVDDLINTISKVNTNPRYTDRLLEYVQQLKELKTILRQCEVLDDTSETYKRDYPMAKPSAFDAEDKAKKRARLALANSRRKSFVEKWKAEIIWN